MSTFGSTFQIESILSKLDDIMFLLKFELNFFSKIRLKGL